MKRSLAILSIVLTLNLFVVQTAYAAAWSYTQTFDALNDGDLNSQDSWTGDVRWDVQTAVKFKGAKAVQAVASTDGGEYIIAREITGVDSGDIYYAERVATTNADSLTFRFYNSGGATIAGYVDLSLGGIHVSENGGYQTITTGLSLDTWYIINVNFVSATTFKVRWKVAGGSFSAFSSTYTWRNSVSSPARITLGISDNAAGTTTGYFDEIGTTDPDVAAAVIPIALQQSWSYWW